MRRCRILLAGAALLLWAGTARAFIPEGAVEGRPGFSFRRLTYYWSHVELEIVNGTTQNAIFGGTMVFLNRHRVPVARVELLPEKIKRRTSRRYRGNFSKGSGEEASSASYLIWVFDQRNN